MQQQEGWLSEAPREGEGTELKASDQQQHAKLTAELFGFSSVSASHAQYLRNGGGLEYNKIWCSIYGSIVQFGFVQYSDCSLVQSSIA